jgi:hypothetical protein
MVGLNLRGVRQFRDGLACLTGAQLCGVSLSTMAPVHAAFEQHVLEHTPENSNRTVCNGPNLAHSIDWTAWPLLALPAGAGALQCGWMCSLGSSTRT